MPTEVTFGDSVSDAPLRSFGRFGAKFLAEEAYVVEMYSRLDREDSLPGSLISE